METSQLSVAISVLDCGEDLLTSMSFLPVIPRKLRAEKLRHSLLSMVTYFPILLEKKKIEC